MVTEALLNLGDRGIECCWLIVSAERLNTDKQPFRSDLVHTSLESNFNSWIHRKCAITFVVHGIMCYGNRPSGHLR